MLLAFNDRSRIIGLGVESRAWNAVFLGFAPVLSGVSRKTLDLFSEACVKLVQLLH